MSQQTLTWLNNFTLIGQTDKRGKAWHYRANEQGAEPNHYPGAIPVADVRRRLFPWQAVPQRVAVELPATVETMTHLGASGEPLRWAVQEQRQAITRSDTGAVLGMFKSGYKPHQYDEWLIKNIETILDDDLQISSAGLLKDGGVAWVEVSVPDTITTPEGVSFRPNLLAATSFDGSLATTIKRTIQATVCDNTLTAALGESGQTLKIRHSSESLGRIMDVRSALGIVHTMADDFRAEVATLTQTEVGDKEWAALVERLVPIDYDADGPRKIAGAENKRGELHRLYNFDPRVSDWTGTAFGALQAFNTWHHHVQGGLAGKTSEEKLAKRAERNALRAIEGATEKADALVLNALADILG